MVIIFDWLAKEFRTISLHETDARFLQGLQLANRPADRSLVPVGIESGKRQSGRSRSISAEVHTYLNSRSDPNL